MPFAGINGQDSALGCLREHLAGGSVFSNYLFVGPDGVGKRTTAVEFAKILNCQNTAARPCGECASCRKIGAANHPDVFIIEPKDASSSIGIDQIRFVITRAHLLPYEAEKKIFIIDNAHTLSEQAQNAFLKTLEEPPADSVFILISRSERLLLPTVVSRCHTVRFFALPSGLIENFLTEKLGLSPEDARILSNFSGGRIGEAKRAHENGLIGKKNAVIDAFLDKREGVFEVGPGPVDKDALKKELGFVISYLRDLFLYKAANREEGFFHADRAGEIKKNASRYSAEEIEGLIKKAICLFSYVDYNVNPKIIKDVLSSERQAFLCMR